ncbi:MAG TPA: YbhB/YbcL family Raf kinase inhibitor-like protein [Steroidobacteraceae bacterium]|nr:YbhB/YbcL family Raf kinase inhibitor-like protein [Steroidobacteraceae bacterium]
MISAGRPPRGCAATLALLCIATSAFAAEPFTLTSSTFKDGTMLPLRYTGDLKTNPNCLGENVSPALHWSNAPAGTKSFALLLIDPEGRNGLGVVHWVAYDIPATVDGFAEGEVSKPSSKYVGGKSIVNRSTYFGPCPPPDTAPHHYTFTLIATDLEPGALPPGLTRDELLAKLQGHTKAAAGIVALYKHP